MLSTPPYAGPAQDATRHKLVELNRDELIALARRMFERDPEMATLVDGPTGRGRAVRQQDVERQIRLALRPAVHGDCRASSIAAREVQEIASRAATFLDGRR